MTQSIRPFFDGLGRIAFLVGALLLSVVLAAPSSVAQDVPVVTDDVVDSGIQSGEEIEVPIRVRNLDQAADIFSFDVTLDYSAVNADFVEFRTAGTLSESFGPQQSDDEANSQASLGGFDSESLADDGVDSGVLAYAVFNTNSDNVNGGVTLDVSFNDVNDPGKDLTQADFEILTTDAVANIENTTATVGSPSTMAVTASGLSGNDVTSLDISIEVEEPAALNANNPVTFLGDLENATNVNANYAEYANAPDTVTVGGFTTSPIGDGPLFELNVEPLQSETSSPIPITFSTAPEFRNSSGNLVNDPFPTSDGQLRAKQNNAPTSNDDSYQTGENDTREVTDPANGVLGNDTDADGDALSVSAVEGTSGDVGSQITLDSGASLTLNGNGTFTYNPPSEADTLGAGETTDDSFQYTAADPFGGSDQATATITLQGENDTPTISGLGDDDPTTINEDNTAGPIEFTVDDAEGDLSTLSVTGSSGDPDLVQDAGISETGPDQQGAASLTVIPRPDSNGTTSITVEVSDGAKSASGSFTLNVDPDNDPPTISDLPAADTIDEDGSTGPIGFKVSDVESDSSAVMVSGSSGNTDLVPADSIKFPQKDGGDRYVVVTPTADSNGTANITITAEDPDGASTGETLALEVESVPDAPVAANDTFSVDENAELVRSAPNGLLANDSHPDGEAFQAATFALTGPDNGTVNIGSDGAFRYTPAEGFAGTDQFTYQISDGDSSDTGTVTINVEAIEVTISGSVSYPGEGDSTLTDGRALSGVPVQVSAVSGSESAMDTTDTDGNFSVSVGTGEYVVQAQPDRDVPDGEINATDASRTIGAYLGTTPFVDDLQGEVADVNDSGNANATDALKMALFFNDPSGTTFAAGDWASTADTADVTGGSDASVSVMVAAYGDADLSGAEQSSGSTVATARSAASSNAATEEKTEDLRAVKMGKTFEVPVQLSDGETLGSYSLAIDYAAEKVSFEGIAGTDRSVMTKATDGTVRLSWFDRSGDQPLQVGDGGALVTLRFSAKSDVERGDAFTPTVKTGELAGPDAQPLANAKVTVEGVKIGETLPDEFALKGNYPNPVASGQATIEMDLPSRATVTVEVYNVLGQRVQTVERSMAAGTGQTVRIDGSRLSSGQYFYRVKADLQDGTVGDTGRITVVR